MKPFDKFFSEALKQLTFFNCGFEFVFSDKIKLGENYFTNGSFDYTIPKLFVAFDKPFEEWSITFIHEYCHFLQWIENDPCFFMSNVFGIEHVDDYLQGKEVPISQSIINNCLNHVQSLELNNEKRVIDILERWNFSNKIIKNHIKKANAYLFFHEILKIKNSWYKTAPYEVPEIIDLMNDSFYDNYHNISEDVKNLMLEKCF